MIKYIKFTPKHVNALIAYIEDNNIITTYKPTESIWFKDRVDEGITEFYYKAYLDGSALSYTMTYKSSEVEDYVNDSNTIDLTSPLYEFENGSLKW